MKRNNRKKAAQRRFELNEENQQNYHRLEVDARGELDQQKWVENNPTIGEIKTNFTRNGFLICRFLFESNTIVAIWKLPRNVSCSFWVVNSKGVFEASWILFVFILIFTIEERGERPFLSMKFPRSILTLIPITNIAYPKSPINEKLTEFGRIRCQTEQRKRNN